MNKNTIFQNFTLSLVNFIPVIFFFLTCSILGFYLNSFLFIIGSLICFIYSLLNVISFFAFKLDSSKLKANWIEQICNPISQRAFFIAILIIILN